MKKNTIEKFYRDENGILKVEMTQDTARDLVIAMEAFNQGISYAQFIKDGDMRCLWNYIKRHFLEDEQSAFLAKSEKEFFDTIEQKVKELTQ